MNVLITSNGYFVPDNIVHPVSAIKRSPKWGSVVKGVRRKGSGVEGRSVGVGGGLGVGGGWV